VVVAVGWESIPVREPKRYVPGSEAMNEEAIWEEEAIAEERAVRASQFAAAIMRRPIRSLTTLKPPITLPRGATVREAVDKMNRGRVGCVLIEEGGRLVGVFTERDVLTKVVAKSLDVHHTMLDRVMTADPECLTPDDRIAYALNKMSVGGFRHIPLVDAQGRPAGVVAMRNIVDYIVDLFPGEVLNLPPEPGLSVSRSREGA
jgi:CBS domain-containing protein